jgi:hypothetical protein
MDTMSQTPVEAMDLAGGWNMVAFVLARKQVAHVCAAAVASASMLGQ